MLSDECVKTLFGSDDEDEKFFNKKDKRKRKISYQPNQSQTKSKKKKKKERKNFSYENKEKINIYDSKLIPVERKISIDISKFKLKKKKL